MEDRCNKNITYTERKSYFREIFKKFMKEGSLITVTLMLTSGADYPSRNKMIVVSIELPPPASDNFHDDSFSFSHYPNDPPQESSIVLQFIFMSADPQEDAIIQFDLDLVRSSLHFSLSTMKFEEFHIFGVRTKAENSLYLDGLDEITMTKCTYENIPNNTSAARVEKYENRSFIIQTYGNLKHVSNGSPAHL
jgi:hypothetical protein